MKLRTLLALLAISLLIGCPTRGSSGRGGDDDDDDDDSAVTDDDDATGDDDDATGDDDDATGDDDDTTGDDDDTTGDDDDTVGDDDDSTNAGPGQLILSANSTDFGNVSIGGSGSRTVVLNNPGGAAVSWELAFTWDGSGVFSVTGGSTTGTLGAGGSTTRTVIFAPNEALPAFTALKATHDGSNTSPAFVYFEAVGGNALTEANCADGFDDDGDGYPDCEDWDCIQDPACGDPCCGTMPWPGSDTMCDNQATLQCLCNADPYCCSQGWNAFCYDLYSGVTAGCPAASCPQ